MDPQLFVLLVDLAASADVEPRYEIISGYRAPKPTRSCASNGGGQAKNSQHIQGKAIDVRLKGVDTATLRDLARDLKRGGVGYYPEIGLRSRRHGAGAVLGRVAARSSLQFFQKNLFKNHIFEENRSMPAIIPTTLLLIASNVFMTFAWYAHLEEPCRIGPGISLRSSAGASRCSNIYCRYPRTESGTRRCRSRS